jgi:beta-glucanase (GH16 family)
LFSKNFLIYLKIISWPKICSFWYEICYIAIVESVFKEVNMLKNFKLLTPFIGLILWLVACSLEPGEKNDFPIDPATPEEAYKAYSTTGYTLVWSDEFDGSSLNTSKWVYDIGGGGWGNNELEYYTSRTQNVSVSSGTLKIISLKENYNGYAYTSGRIKTKGKFQFQYGKIVARIRLSSGNRQGIWPAFWMLGANIDSVGWPKCGEIDIMENINGQNTVYATCHWDANGHAQYGLSTSVTVTSWHDYEVEWDSQYIRARVDGTQYYVIDITPADLSEFRAPFFILLNQAVGGNWPGSPSSSTVFPSTMEVDYVRVYQKSGAESYFIEAESYDAMSGVQTESCSEGGLNVGWIDTGDWMAYPAITFTGGTYKIEYRVASPNTGGKLSADLDAGAIQLGQVTIPNTGGWQNWTTVSHTVTIPAGSHRFGIYAAQGGWNINWIKITRQ